MKDDKLAYPLAYDSYEVSFGLTRRELFAAMAMQGMLAADDWNWNPSETHQSTGNAVRFADALIKELDK